MAISPVPSAVREPLIREDYGCFDCSISEKIGSIALGIIVTLGFFLALPVEAAFIYSLSSVGLIVALRWIFFSSYSTARDFRQCCLVHSTTPVITQLSGDNYMQGTPTRHPPFYAGAPMQPHPLHNGQRAPVGSDLTHSPQLSGNPTRSPPHVPTLFRPSPRTEQTSPLVGRANVGSNSAPRLSGDPLTHLGVVLQNSADPRASPLLPVRRAQVGNGSSPLSGAPTQ